MVRFPGKVAVFRDGALRDGRGAIIPSRMGELVNRTLLRLGTSST